MTHGRFITLEGGEGVGKSTGLSAVGDCLRALGLEVILTREPGGTPLGEELRGLLLRGTALCEEAELMILFAARVQHVRQVILPALNSGVWVVSDRFTDSSYAYQGGGRGVDPAAIERMESLLPGCLQPDLTLLLDAPVELGLARARRRGDMDRFEAEDTSFQERVRQAYLARAERFSHRFVTIDANGTVDEVRVRLLNALEARCAEWL